MFVYSQENPPLFHFSSVTIRSISSILRLGLMFNVFPGLISTGTLFELSITGIISVLLTKASSISYSCSCSFKVMFMI